LDDDRGSGRGGGRLDDDATGAAARAVIFR
jgi:hypothetical protein